MTQEEKQLLLNDLCARLPYYTELYSNASDDNWAILTPVVISNLINADKDLVIKPYLRPMSSMTEEKLKEFYMVEGMDTNPVILNKPQYDWHFTTNDIDYLLSRHFDFRGLIPMGLALEATKGMYKQ